MDEKKTKVGSKGDAISFKQNIVEWSFTLSTWGIFIAVAIIAYHQFSDGDFSFLMTLSSLSKSFGILLLFVKVLCTKSVKGISLKSLQLYFILYFCRIVSIYRHDGYLPYDKSGDWLYHLIEVLGLCQLILMIYLTSNLFSSNYEKEYDVFGEIYDSFFPGISFLVLPCCVFAVLFHPHLCRDWISDVSWILSMYLETVALVPQLYMFHRQPAGKINGLISHFVAALGLARIFDLWFWLYTFKELSGGSSDGDAVFSGSLVLISQFIHLILLSDYFYCYFQAIHSGKGMSIPERESYAQAL